VPAGNGRVGNLKRVFFHPANGRALHVQVKRATGHALVQDNKFGHSFVEMIMVAVNFKSNANQVCSAVFFNQLAEFAK
jgi:hypothetical protein